MATEDNPTVNVGVPDAVDVSSDKNGGVRKVITNEGRGVRCPTKGSQVTVHYTGKLTNGEVFDSSVDRGTPFEFTLGEGNVIKAWDEGVASMKKGECATLHCSPDYAYGEAGSPPKIPPNSELIFDVELIGWKGKSVLGTDGKVSKHIIEEGEKFSTPNESSSVKVHLKGTYNDAVFDEREESYVVGEGDEKNIPKGVDLAVRDMKNGEKCLLEIPPEFGFGGAGWLDKSVPANSDIEYEVHLKSFEKAKEGWEMDEAEKIEQSEVKKGQGTEAFKAGKFELAKKKYSKIVEWLQDETFKEENKERGDALLLAGHLNLAMCQIKTKDFADAVESCTKALELDAKNEKGLYRRGQGNLELQNYGEAKADFEAVLAINGSNKAAKNQLVMTQHKEKAAKEKQKRIYKGMFERFAAQDAQKAPAETASNGDSGAAPENVAPVAESGDAMQTDNV